LKVKGCSVIAARIGARSRPGCRGCVLGLVVPLVRVDVLARLGRHGRCRRHQRCPPVVEEVEPPLVASTLIWIGVLNEETGWVNGLLALVGLQGPDWLNDPGWVLPSLGIVGLWGIGSMMLISLAGIQGIPTELYDAARVDGAGAWTTFRRITLPLLTPVLFYSLLISCVGVSQYFIQAYVLTNGQPDASTLFYNVNLYREAFSFNQLGYASALAWVLFLIVLGLAMLLFWSSSRWVFYAGERR
jgi:multiple sugar transport system permease protein